MKMKYLIFILVVLASVASSTIYENVFSSEWSLFKEKYQKSYSSLEEENRRLNIFKETKYKIAKNNEMYYAGAADFLMGINQFSDMLPEEVNNMYNNRGLDDDWGKIKKVPFVPSLKDVPKNINWVEKGAVTPIRDQKACGSCYAFASVATLESRHFIKNNKSEVFSVQQIIDCSKEDGNHGCNGGLASTTYYYLSKIPGINHESTYPYEAKDGVCRVNHTDVGAKVTGYGFPKPYDEEELMKAVAEGPVSVSIDSGLSSFHNYKSGIYYDAECSSVFLGHAVVIVGYGTDEATKKDYWIIRNSWGTTWGDNGYMKMQRNVNNMCGPATRPVFPVVA